MSLNRGKESVALNLKDENDREVFENLLARADVLVENYRPGVMEKLGYGWEDLHARYPRLIYAAASGFERRGPVGSGEGRLMRITELVDFAAAWMTAHRTERAK